MTIQRLIPFALLAFAGLSLGSGCPTIPKIEDRVVEMAVGASTTLEFVADGATNVWSESGDYNLATQIDISQILDDAGIDVEDVKDIKLSGVSYRVTVPDATPNRTVTASTLKASRGGGPATDLVVTNTSERVDAAFDWKTAPLSAAGVTLINGLLTDILNAAKNHTAVANPVVSYTYDGTSTPVNVATQFTYQVRLDVSIVGTIKVKVLD